MENKFPWERVKREILIKRESETDEKYGVYPEQRSIQELINYGVVNMNKPSGPTSHEVSAYVKNILNIKRAGHSGSLDPNVTGCLPIALENVTRVVQVLLTAGKEYVCLMHLHNELSKEKIEEIFNSFIGKTNQLPPIKSSVKRRVREREIYYIELLETNERNILFKIGSEAGFYIRKFCHDFGIRAKTGAHMLQLIRTRAGPFNEDTMVSLHDLKDAYEFWKNESDEKELRICIQPIENAIKHLPKIWVVDSAVSSVCYGASLSTPGIVKLESNIKIGDNIALLTLKNELMGFGSAELSSNEIMDNSKGIVVKTNKVFMDRNLYPRKW